MSASPSTPSLADRFFVEAMSPAFREDPYPYYERFRGPSPLLRVAETIWFALGHADVTTLLRHPRMSTDEQQHAATEAGNALDPNRTRSLLFMDPPDHTRLRNLVARAFTPRRIEGLRAATEAITAELLDAMPADGTPVDLIQAFAYPLPVRVICRLLGIPEADEAVFTGWSHGIARSLDPSVLRSPAIDATIDQARSELRAYLGALLEFRRKSPAAALLPRFPPPQPHPHPLPPAQALSLPVL